MKVTLKTDDGKIVVKEGAIGLLHLDGIITVRTGNSLSKFSDKVIKEAEVKLHEG